MITRQKLVDNLAGQAWGRRKAVSCSDTDNLNEFTKGTRTYIYKKRVKKSYKRRGRTRYYYPWVQYTRNADDKCYRGKLIEYYCNGKNAKYNRISCPDGCRDGACKPKPRQDDSFLKEKPGGKFDAYSAGLVPNKGKPYKEGKKMVYWNLAGKGATPKKVMSEYKSGNNLTQEKPLDAKYIDTPEGKKVIVKWAKNEKKENKVVIPKCVDTDTTNTSAAVSQPEYNN